LSERRVVCHELSLNNELRKLRDGYALQGFMYLPQLEPVLLDAPEERQDEYDGHAAALIYRPTTVSQALLDCAPRITRLTADATRILDAALIQTYTPNNFDWKALAQPDLSDGWTSLH
jgi:hypothetical protein